MDQVNASDVDSTVFIGDIQGGDPCVNQLYTTATDTFNSFDKPMVYTPGPLVDPVTGQPVTNVTRVESFGSPSVGVGPCHARPC